MKLLKVKSPVGLRLPNRETQWFKPSIVYEVDDETANHPFLAYYLESVEDVIEPKPIRKTRKPRTKKEIVKDESVNAD